MLNSILGTELTLTSFLLCTGVSLLLGIGTALVAGYRSRSTQSCDFFEHSFSPSVL